MNLQAAQHVAKLILSLGKVRYRPISDVVGPFYKILREYASQGQEIVYGRLFYDSGMDEWIFQSEEQSDYGPDCLDHSAEGMPPDLNEKYTYESVGLYTTDSCLDFVQVLAVGEVEAYDEGADEPPADPMDTDEILAYALRMSKHIVDDEFGADHFSDTVHDYAKDMNQERLGTIRPRTPHLWGQFNAKAKEWREGDRETRIKALEWLKMNSTGHPYPEAVQLRVKAGYSPQPAKA
jgi:hypothetical protein